MYLLGYDIGSSSIKVALVTVDTREVVGIEQFPKEEMPILSHNSGWAEQDPEMWWKAVIHATKSLLFSTQTRPDKIAAIGIAYQMHGLVIVDKSHTVLRPSIIWCDSRAVGVGEQALEALSPEYCFGHCLNAPGNFTASKMKWVIDNEPAILDKAYKFMLPGDYIAMKMTGEIRTTISGLSEGILWDFKTDDIALPVLNHFGIHPDQVPGICETFERQGMLTLASADLLGLKQNTPVTYRSGDQPNNAMALGVIHPGQVAGTGGTSGVLYGITDKLISDDQSRINTFAHVNHTSSYPRLGLLLCINGAGIQYAWLNHQVGRSGLSYDDMEKAASSIPIGSDGLRILPFGNGAERMLLNRDIGAHMIGIQFNRHHTAHLYRAALEGIAFSFVKGFDTLKNLGMHPNEIRVGNDNLFQSPVFSTTIASMLNIPITVIDTTGAVGAALASGIGKHIYRSPEEAFEGLETVKIYPPVSDQSAYQMAYNRWSEDLDSIINKTSHND